QLPFEQILLSPLRSGLGDEAMVRSDLLFAEQFQRIVLGRNRAITMILARCGFDLTVDQRVQSHAPDDARSGLSPDGEHLFIVSEELQLSDLWGVYVGLKIDDLIRPLGDVVVQSRPTLLVVLREFCENPAFGDPRPQRLDRRWKLRQPFLRLSLRPNPKQRH